MTDAIRGGDMVGVIEFARLTNVHPQTVRTFIRQGLIRAARAAGGQCSYRIPRSEVAVMLEMRDRRPEPLW